MLDRMNSTTQGLENELDFDYFERYSFEEEIETTGVQLTDEFCNYIGRFFGHWNGDFTFAVDGSGYIVGYEYWTYEEDELYRCNDIRRDIESTLALHKQFS